jgi:PHD/YefM family antitoxin component YafN of YafNO toxin-antitoxin module
MTTKRVSVAEAKRDLPRLLRESRQADIMIFNERARALAGVIVSAATYEELSRLKAYREALRLSEQTRNRMLDVRDLIRRARIDLRACGL